MSFVLLSSPHRHLVSADGRPTLVLLEVSPCQKGVLPPHCPQVLLTDVVIVWWLGFSLRGHFYVLITVWSCFICSASNNTLNRKLGLSCLLGPRSLLWSFFFLEKHICSSSFYTSLYIASHLFWFLWMSLGICRYCKYLFLYMRHWLLFSTNQFKNCGEEVSRNAQEESTVSGVVHVRLRHRVSEGFAVTVYLWCKFTTEL